MSLETFLESLADPSIPLSNSNFIEVSDLAPAELGQFARAWFRLSLERRREIVGTLVELAEDSPDLDFCTVFKMCLKDQDDRVLEKAIDGLWEYEDRSVIPGLIQIPRFGQKPGGTGRRRQGIGQVRGVGPRGDPVAQGCQLGAG